MRLKVLLASTRPGRVGPAVAHWLMHHPSVYEHFDDVELVDLAEIDLPLLDEPHHPRMQAYTQRHTRLWSQVVDRADAFVVVTPEYNLAPPPPLVNAIDYLHAEWRWKAAAVVSYGGAAGGVRSAQIVKQMLAAMNCFTVHEAVAVPTISQRVDDAGGLDAPIGADHAAELMLTNLAHLSRALRCTREADLA